eukprot:CAMPEP_0176073374 /NCGR_PEP_ID=MMETSP0120_2-20121206/36661_1 /TAXON_ID=160619 /ORGANISM="Kryptoperidinium foliaceum, Strain CCMP 1326" /LENGTH=409 /DNA_ID=CAMNT_0017407055 /DNA_START=27 /DNA_END=1253 /DNA_ORIENTATION=-
MARANAACALRPRPGKGWCHIQCRQRKLVLLRLQVVQPLVEGVLKFHEGLGYLGPARQVIVEVAPARGNTEAVQARVLVQTSHHPIEHEAAGEPRDAIAHSAPSHRPQHEDGAGGARRAPEHPVKATVPIHAKAVGIARALAFQVEQRQLLIACLFIDPPVDDEHRGPGTSVLRERRVVVEPHHLVVRINLFAQPPAADAGACADHSDALVRDEVHEVLAARKEHPHILRCERADGPRVGPAVQRPEEVGILVRPRLPECEHVLRLQIHDVFKGRGGLLEAATAEHAAQPLLEIRHANIPVPWCAPRYLIDFSPVLEVAGHAHAFELPVTDVDVGVEIQVGILAKRPIQARRPLPAACDQRPATAAELPEATCDAVERCHEQQCRRSDRPACDELRRAALHCRRRRGAP